jgi:hypothetical protein
MTSADIFLTLIVLFSTAGLFFFGIIVIGWLTHEKLASDIKVDLCKEPRPNVKGTRDVH